MPGRTILSRLGTFLCGAAVVIALALPTGSVAAAEPSAGPAVQTLEGVIETAAPAGRVNARAAAGLGLREPTSVGPSLPLPAGPVSALTAPVEPSAAPPVATVTGPADLASVGFAGLDSSSLPAGWAENPGWSGVAVGPYDVVQTTSSGFRFSDRAGRGAWEVTYTDFLGSSQISVALDGRVAWDAEHERWIAVATAVRCGWWPEGYLMIAVSETTDPQWFWSYWLLSTGESLPIVPTLGSSSNKVVVGYYGAAITGSGSCFDWAGTDSTALVVVDWSSLIPPGYLDFYRTVQQHPGDRWPWRPALNDPAQPAAPAYALARDADGIELATITGTVASGIVVSVDELWGVAPAPTPDWSGPTDAVRRGTELFMVARDLCDPALDGTAPCVRISSVSTSGTSWLQDFTIGIEGQDVSQGAVEVAGDGTLHVTFSARPSSPQAGVGASTWAVHQAKTAPAGTVSPPTLIARGAYLPSGDVLGGVSRLAPDPSDPHAVWQADAYGGRPGGGWSTWVSQLRTGVPEAPAGLLSIESGRPTTHALDVRLSAVPASGSRILLSSSNATAAGKLSHALDLEPSPDILWDLADPAYGGSTATGDRRVYFQWGDGAGAWSSVQSAVIRYAGPPAVIRIYGADRYATAAAVARTNYAPGVPAVYVATGLNFPDALAGAGAAGFEGAPVLLVTADRIPAATAQALTSLKPERIVILGGTGVVSNPVRTALAAYVPGGAASVSRLAGPDRYATAAAISAATYEPGVNEVLIATGLNFPDALAGTAIAARDGAPLLLVTRTTVPSATAAELARLKPHRIVILGGEGVVGPALVSALRKYTDGGIFRVSGADRYETAAAISWVWFGEHPAVGFVATGLNFPDALAGGALAGRLGSPLVLVPGISIPAPIDEVLEFLAPPEFDVLGGPSVVSNGVMTSLASYLGP